MVRIRDIMSKEVITTSPDSTLIEAARLMASKTVRSLVVLDNDKPVGIVNDNEIVIGAANKKAKVRDIMKDEFIVVSPHARLQEVERMMRQRKLKRYPVVENERLLGLVTETDMIEATRDFTRIHQIVQEIILAIFGLATAFFLFYFSPLGGSIFR